MIEQYIFYVIIIYWSFSSVLVVLLRLPQPGASSGDDVHAARTFNDRPGTVVLVHRGAVNKRHSPSQTGGPRRNEETARQNPGGRKLGRKLLKIKKNGNRNRIFQGTLFIIWCYGFKFLPTMAVVLASYIGILTSHCDEICAALGNCTCAFFYNPIVLTDSVAMGGWDENEWTLLTSRLIVSFIVLLHFGEFVDIFMTCRLVVSKWFFCFRFSDHLGWVCA